MLAVHRNAQIAAAEPLLMIWATVLTRPLRNPDRDENVSKRFSRAAMAAPAMPRIRVAF